jgi:chorismate mutase / prephenate dehydratase
MADQPPSLQDLRRQLDATDDALHELLIKRGEILEGVARSKLGGAGGVPFPNAYRPTRETQVLARRLARHSGVLPVSLIVRMWREILATALYFQSPFTVHVCGGDNATPLWDAARGAFGIDTPMTMLQSPVNLVRTCAQSPASIGVLPWPSTDASQPAWWTQLATPDASGPRIVARLPFFQEEKDRDRQPLAAVIATAPYDATGDDSTMAVVDVPGDLSRARLLSLLKQAGLGGYVLAANGDARNGGQQLLVLLEGFVTSDDARLVSFMETARDQISWMRVIGGFANPIVVPATVEAHA